MKRVRTAVRILFFASCILWTVYLVEAHMLADHTPPEISFDKEKITVSVKAGDAQLLKGVTAQDDRDGDITDAVRISSKSHFIGQGRRIVTYVVFDKADHAASAERTIVYKDYVPPRIYMDKPLRYTISEAKNADLLKNMTVEDCLSGNLNSHIRMSLEDTWYDLDPGDYSLTVQVSNEAGDTCEIPMTATIVDNSLIESKKYYPILSDYVVYTTVNKPLALEDYTTGVMRGNTEYLFGGQETVVTPENIKITSAIDYSVPGVYEVKYSYTSLEGVTAVTTLYAVVEE